MPCNDKVFGVGLVKIDIVKTIKEYFKELSCGRGSVRATLEKYMK